MSEENWRGNMDKLAGLQGSEGAPSPLARSYYPPAAQPAPPSMPAAEYSPAAPFMQSTNAVYVNAQPQNGMGTASLVLGIIGMIPFPITGFWCSLLAIIFGAKGCGRANRGLATNKVMSTWGLWLGIVGMGIHLLLSLAIALS